MGGRRLAQQQLTECVGIGRLGSYLWVGLRREREALWMAGAEQG